MKCLVCGNEAFELFHKGTRDHSEVDVMKCSNCRSLQLSSFSQVYEGFYEEGNMRKNQYDASKDEYTEEMWDSWVKETRADDCRRTAMLGKMCVGGGNILDFGCGNGGFLKRLREEKITNNIMGVELDREACKRLHNDKINVYQRLNDIDEEVTFNVVTMFHVIEHLKDPGKVVSDIKNRLADGGLLVIETPNAEDALISQYHSRSFMDFTFWSEHLFLYTSESLEMLMRQGGFSVVSNGQIQRYPLSNHLYWLSENMPGGHVKWNMLDDDKLNKEYENKLRGMNKCDTLFGIFRKD